ncbi:Gfo/Idh/MocA family oxidoreductase [Bacillus sp. 1P06AnD]|uniref:Gfo/Idh/MocA family oxidoreductase n=1 Tax=Bacillus sp. 1P06AnD TaxID=3132208 RepID=UPI0039A11334
MSKIGIIGTDSTHAISFTEQLNHTLHPYHIPGGTVIGFYPSRSPAGTRLHERQMEIEGKLANKHGVKPIDRIHDIAEMCDAFLVLTVDPCEKRAQLKQLLTYGKPIFADKPISLSVEEANCIFEAKTPIMSSSALRFVTPFEAFKKTMGGKEGTIRLNGPLSFHAAVPGYFWYGIHLAEMVVSLKKGLPDEMAVEQDGNREIVNCYYDHQLIKMIFESQSPFRLNMDGYSMPLDAGSEPIYTGLLREIMSFFKSGQSPVANDETLDIIRMLNRINGLSGAYAQFLKRRSLGEKLN